EVVDADKPPSYDMKKPHNQTYVRPVFPGDGSDPPITAELWDETKNVRRPFTPDEIRRLRNGNAYVAGFGTFLYTDQFGLHWSRFCLWYSYAPGTFAATSCVDWNFSGDGKPPASAEIKFSGEGSGRSTSGRF